MSDVLTLVLNGENRQFEAPVRGSLSVLGLLAELGLDMRKVAVERNEEIVHFIGGG